MELGYALTLAPPPPAQRCVSLADARGQRAILELAPPRPWLPGLKGEGAPRPCQARRAIARSCGRLPGGRHGPTTFVDGTQSSLSLTVPRTPVPNWLFVFAVRRTCFGCPLAPFAW